MTTRATGFDTVFDRPFFIGGPFSFFSHQGFNLGGTSVNFKQRDSLAIDFRTSKSEGQSNFVNPGVFIAYLVGFGGWVIYMAFGWRTNGRTYGDYLLGLRVRTIRGEDVGGVRAVIRALLCGIAPLLLVWCAISKQERSVQDLIVGTHVVYDWGGSRQRTASNDAARVGVDVAAPVPDESNDGHAEPLPRIDRER